MKNTIALFALVAATFGFGMAAQAHDHLQDGTVTVGERADVHLQTKNWSDDSFVVNVSLPRSNALLGIGSIQALGDGAVGIDEHAHVSTDSSYNGNVINVALWDSTAVTGIGSIQAVQINRHH